MSSAVITLIGMYSYQPSIFDNLQLPSQLDRDVAINTIIMRGGEYEVNYPNPDIFSEFIRTWSIQKESVINNWLRALNDLGLVAPLENYDRIENWSDSGENETTIEGEGSTSGNDSSIGDASVTSTDKISADDVSNFVNKTQNEQSNHTTTSATTKTDSTTKTKNEGNFSNSHSGRVHGNIGVTTSSTMYAEWIKTVREFGDIYDLIATMFLQDFTIPIL